MLKNKSVKEKKYDLTNAFKPKAKLSKLDSSTKWFIIIFSMIILLLLLVLFGFITYKSVPALHEVGFFKFIFGTKWKPGPDGTDASYGIMGIMGATVMMLIISLLFAIPLTIFGSLFICEYLRPRAKKMVVALIQLMAGIPSVVFGLFALDQIGNMFVWFGAKTPSNMMTAAFALAFMALPTMMALTIDAVESVPDGYRFASLGLGVTKEKTTFNVILKSALPKIITAIIAGMARIIGETMAVIMISGGNASPLNVNDGFGGFIFSSMRTLAGTIGLEMLENSGNIHESALYAIGLVLFFLVIIINLVILAFSRKRKFKKIKSHASDSEINIESSSRKIYSPKQLKVIVRDYTERRFWQSFESIVLKFFMITSMLMILGFIGWILVTILLKGILSITWVSFVTLEGNKSGIFATFVVTILLVIATLTFSLPLAIIVAIYLAVYAPKKSWTTKLIRFVISILSSTPSIVFGVFGLSLFVTVLRIPMSIFASSLTLTFVVLPSLISVMEESINAVPESYREAAYGMGLGKTATLLKVVLPDAFKGMITGIVLTVSRIFGESAPIYLTLGTSVRMPASGFLSSGATMTTEIYVLVSEGSSGQAMKDAYMISLFAMIIIILLNWFSHYLSKRLNPGYKKVSMAVLKQQMKIKFGRKNISRTWKNFLHIFVVGFNRVKFIFNFKKIYEYVVRHRAIKKEIKDIKTEVRKNGR
jgi:phosphate transport system permease protein